MARTPKKKEYPDLICGIPRANLEQFARFICPYVEAYYADEKNMAEYQKEKENDKLSHNFASKNPHFHCITMTHGLHGRCTGDADRQKAGASCFLYGNNRLGFLSYHRNK